MPPKTPQGKIRKMPIRKLHIELDGDYEGWWFEFRQNPPLGAIADGLAMATGFDPEDPKSSASAVKGMGLVVKTTLVDWNFVDTEGQDLPLNDEGIAQLGLDLITLMFSRVTEAIGSAPLVSSGQ